MLHLEHLWLTDFRSYRTADVEFPAGTTAIIGRNGQGKTNLLEAVGHLAGTSVRGANAETMVRSGAERGFVRGQARRNNRELLLEAELAVRGRSRIQCNRQPVRRRRDLLEALLVTVFSPDDLVLVKGSPSGRRDWLDEAAAPLDPTADPIRVDVDRILRQRNALLKQVRGRPDESASATLDVWDHRLATAGEQLADGRGRALDLLAPAVSAAYAQLAGRDATVTAHIQSSWTSHGLAESLALARADDLRRGVTTVGPHRDDVVLTLDGMPARTHASQGEQRSLALALRLAVHRTVAAHTGVTPVLLLDDVFSELDGSRSEALVANLPAGQTLLTTAGPLPTSTVPDLVLVVADGAVAPGPGGGST